MIWKYEGGCREIDVINIILRRLDVSATEVRYADRDLMQAKLVLPPVRGCELLEIQQLVSSNSGR